MPYYAHIRQDENGQTIYQTVAEHLTGTAALYRKFAADFGAEADGDLMGLAHDLGKCTDAFQKRLLEGGPVVDHTTAGMLTCIKMKRPSAAACAAGHHGGLLDVGNLRTDRAGEATLSGRFKKGVEGHYLERCGESGVTLPTLPPETPERDPLKASFRTRMLYSCLVDADFLDTERFMDGERGRGGYDDLPTLLRRLKEYIAPWQNPKTALNKFSAVIGGGTYGGLSDNDLRAALKRLANGLPCDDLGVDPNRPFYILGLAPNAARLSVRFFLRDSFGKLMENVNAHYARLEIAGAKYSILPLWALLNATVRDSKKQVPSPVVSGATLRAVFSGTPYPVSLMEAVLLRIRAERDITWGKAAIIKAYYLKNPHEDCPKEVLTVSLNEASTNPAYTLGRLFSVYEAVQQAANPGINATIKDKYFNSAAAMPASIFPVLNNLCQKHLRKLDARQRVYYDKQIMKLKGVLNENYPARMTLAQQGSFDLGYYHQTQKRYTKKEEKENV